MGLEFSSSEATNQLTQEIEELKGGFLMNSLQGKSYLQITHTDLDGVGALVLSESMGLMITPLFVDYSELYTSSDESIGELQEGIKQKITSHVGTCDIILVTDVSTSPAARDFLLSFGKPVYVFDHHEISLALDGLENCFVTKAKSGTMLYSEWLHKETGIVMSGAWHRFANLVDTYDRYDDESSLWEEAQNLNRVFWGTLKYFIPQGEMNRYASFMQIQLQKFNAPFFMFTPYELTVIEKQVEKENAEYRLARMILQTRVDSKGLTYGMWHGASKISIVCYRLLQDLPNLDYIININTYNDSQGSGKREKKVNGKLSIRSRKSSNIDVTKLRNINGHTAAGGGQFDIEFITNMWKDKNVHLGYSEE